MRVSTRVEYGLIALMDIALHSENGSCVATWEDSPETEHIEEIPGTDFAAA